MVYDVTQLNKFQFQYRNITIFSWACVQKYVEPSPMASIEIYMFAFPLEWYSFISYVQKEFKEFRSFEGIKFETLQTM
jgi:hypothetical protein